MKYAPLALVALGLACCNSKSSEPASGKAAESRTGGDASLGSSVGKGTPGTEPRPGDLPKARPELRESIEYYDGATRRKLWLSEDLVAEFDPRVPNRDWILELDPAAREVPQPQASARIWRLAGPLRGQAFTSRIPAESMRVSPVLHEGPSPDLPMRALPGGVVVTFAAGWDRARIDAWLAARNLRVQGDAVVADANMYLVGTPPGLESVRIANELHESGELVDVAPNFWMQNAAR